MAPLWARAKAPPEALPRVVVQAAAGAVGPWLDRLSARPDVTIDRIGASDALVRAAHAAHLAIIAAQFPLPPAEDERLSARLRELRSGLPRIPVVALLQCGDAPQLEEGMARQRDGLFAAGSTDVLFLPADADRLEEAIGQFAGVTVRRYVRHRVQIAAVVWREGIESSAQIENLSAGGVQIRIASAPAAGSVLKISLPLDRNRAFHGWGIVRNVAEGGKSAVVRLRFVGMRGPERIALEAFLASLDKDTRSTEPSDAIAAARRLDANSLRAALSDPAQTPDWLMPSVAALSEDEKRALGQPSPSGAAAMRVEIAVARIQGMAVAGALEKYDPALDGEPAQVRETVVGALNRVAHARALLDAWPSEPGLAPVSAAIDDAAGRLTRAVAARLPDISAAWERAGARPPAVSDLGVGENTGLTFVRRGLRNRLAAVAAGLLLGAAAVYTVVAHIARVSVP